MHLRQSSSGLSAVADLPAEGGRTIRRASEFSYSEFSEQFSSLTIESKNLCYSDITFEKRYSGKKFSEIR